jgi:glycosyltransferase involved in cell wall biosynthesis
MTSILVCLERKQLGGAERATSLILSLLAKEGFKITVLTGMGSLKKIPNVRLIYSPLLDMPSKLHLWLALTRPRLIDHFSKFIKESDVVYVPRLAYPVIPLAKKLGKKVVVHLHDYQPLSYCAAAFSGPKQTHSSILSDMQMSLQYEILQNAGVKRAVACSSASLFNKLCGLWLEDSDEIICVSKKQREIIVSSKPELSRKLKVIYNPLPNQSFVKKRFPKEPSMMYLGGDSYAKGFTVFMGATYKILIKNRSLKFQLAGCLKSDRSSAVISALNQRFNGAYHVLGQTGYENIIQLHSTNCALIFPSIGEEPLPYAVVESMLFGTLPIASRSGGVPEIVQGSFAEKLLFQPNDVDDCVDKISSLLTMPQKQISEAGMSLRADMLKIFDPQLTRRKLLETFSS